MKKLIFIFLLSFLQLNSHSQVNNSDDSLQSPITFNLVEKEPIFPGGEEALFKYLESNIHYPREALELGISGTVFVNFIVESDGSISNISIFQGVDPLLDNEAMRVVGLMPKWEPAIQKGEPVRVNFNLPIKFLLQVYDPVIDNKKKKKR